jgi:hypothetical protein
MEKRRDMSPEIAQMPRKPRKGSKADPTPSLRRNTWKER